MTSRAARFMCGQGTGIGIDAVSFSNLFGAGDFAE